jgi:hypothetical protein
VSRLLCKRSGLGIDSVINIQAKTGISQEVARVAQLVERMAFNHVVMGSSPISGVEVMPVG